MNNRQNQILLFTVIQHLPRNDLPSIATYFGVSWDFIQGKNARL